MSDQVVVDIKELNFLVSEAIRVANGLEDSKHPQRADAHAQVSILEEKITHIKAATEVEGRIARRGAVRAAAMAGDYQRAAELAKRFCNEADAPEELKGQLRQLATPAA